MKRGLVLLFVFIFAANAFAQGSLSVFDVDASNFPTMKAKFYAFDANGNQQSPNPSDITITEDGVPRTVLSVTCPPPSPVKQISLVMSIDISGSMSSSDAGQVPVELGKLTAKELVGRIVMPPSEMALQTCNDQAVIVQDFTSNKQRLLDRITPINAGGGNDFVEHLLNSTSGLLNIAKNGKYKRVAVLYTDAYWGALSSSELQECISLCKNNGITFYAIIYTRPEAEPNGIKASLSALAKATGGTLYDGITSDQAAKDIAKILQQQTESGGSPCEISWQSDVACINNNRKLVFSWHIYSVATEYPLSANMIASLSFSPQSVFFNSKPIGVKFDTVITVTAFNAEFVINNIISTNPEYDINPKNFLLVAGESKTITISFTPRDSSYNWTSFELQTNKCNQYYYADGGYPYLPKQKLKLKVISPNGGEVFVVGSDSLVMWTGIPLNERVKIDYSSNNGNTWQLVTDTASGGKYQWKVPAITTSSALIRVSKTKLTSTDSIGWKLKKVLNIFDSAKVDDAIEYGRLSPDNRRIIIQYWVSGFQLYDVLSGDILFTLTTSKFGQYARPAIFTPDGKYIICYYRYFDNIYLITNDDNPRIIDSIIFSKANSFDHDVFLSKDGTLLSVVGSDSLYLYSMPSLRQVAVFPGKMSKSAISSDNKLLASGNASNAIFHIYDIPSKMEIKQLDSRNSSLYSIQFSPNNGQLLLTNYSTCQLWDLATSTKTILSSNSSTFSNEFYHAKFSNDGQYASCVFGTTSTLHIFKNESQNTYKIDTSLSLPRGLTFDHDQNPNLVNQYYVVKGISDTSLDIYDCQKRKSIFSLYHNFTYPQSFSSLVFSDDGEYLSTTANLTATIWEGPHSISGVDTSDAVFSIVMPQYVSTDIDMGKVVVAKAKDSLITTFIRNTGTYPFRVDSLWLTGSGAFSLVSGIPPFDVPAGAARQVEFRFRPPSVGIHQAQIFVKTQADTFQQVIRGEGVLPQVQALGEVIDFGQVSISSMKDTVINVAIQNIGTAAVNFTGDMQLGPDITQYSVLAGGGAFTLQPNESRTVTLRFSPQFIGPTSGRVGFTHDAPGSPAMLTLFGWGIGGEVYIPDDSAAPGEHKGIPILLGGSVTKNYSKLGAVKFKAEIEFNSSILAPDGIVLPSVIDKGRRTLTIETSWDGLSDTLTVIPFIAALGDAETTTMNIPKFEWLDGFGATLALDVDTRSGTFYVSELCREGGTRLISMNGKFLLSEPIPNPSSSYATIRYELIEEGHTELVITDVIGRKVRTLFNGEAKPGSYSIRVNTDELATGKYFYTLSTPTLHAMKMMLVEH